MDNESIIVFHFGDLSAEMGDHATPDLIGYCKLCGEVVEQEDLRCRGCRAKVVWKGSKRWNFLYLSPADQSSRLLFSKTGVRGFTNGHQLWRWFHIINTLSEGEITSTLKTFAPKQRGRGALAHALNTLELRIKKRSESETEVTENGIPIW